MFSRPTVFVLGAGASYHYGYPTGEELVADVKIKAREFCRIINIFREHRGDFLSVDEAVRLSPAFILEKAGVDFTQDDKKIKTQKQNIQLDAYEKALEETFQECQSIETKLKQVDPPVIDHFLNRNDNLKDIGKFLIAWSILEKEFYEPRCKNKGEHWRGNWYRYILQHLMSGCEKPKDLLSNNVKFVTFNYDVSLERSLYQGLGQNHFFNGTDVVDKFFSDDRIIHVYGKIKEDPISPIIELKKKQTYGNTLTLNSEVLDPCYFASKGIRTIAPREKTKDQASLNLARNAIKEAEEVFILGYGFDKLNSENIGLNEHLYIENITKGFGAETSMYTGKNIYFTNFENKNVISKRASQVFYSNPSAFLPPNGLISSDKRKKVHFEMSTKNVYKALSDDFEIFD